MIKYYNDYYWKGGKPFGRQVVDPYQTEFSYKIIPDPYFRRFSIEKYKLGNFEAIIYDSIFLDFRHLKPIEQQAWSKEMLDSSKCLLRNQDDRAIIIEEYHFEQGLCRLSKIFSVHGVWLGTNKMYYISLKDPINGVSLFDIENRPVMMKIYEADAAGEFTLLLKEEWDMENGQTQIY